MKNGFMLLGCLSTGLELGSTQCKATADPAVPLVKKQLRLILLKPPVCFQPEDVSKAPRLRVRLPAPRGWRQQGKEHKSQIPGDRLKNFWGCSCPCDMGLGKELVNKRGNPR